MELCLRMEEDLRENLWVGTKGGQRQVTLEWGLLQEHSGGLEHPSLGGSVPVHARRWTWIIFKVPSITNHPVTLETCSNYY